ncbi:hypothetical protein DLM45_08585 [Hyphomicrobium methylovorum]|uniref:DUF6691 family protein n=1 Tax=Hyphomicrobium methylovorum TaxID=84 RepID=UPI0015E72CF9|nr:DUF6691 family protein [Hyphomicrobium methylovorum]MBA2126279.1 hypothetical protein [Hyphomicrobium methylovorum]
MTRILATFVSGLLFGVGLAVSGLINPAKVQSFLDIAGAWDPSLAITMAVAVLTTWAGYRVVFARGAPLLDKTFHVPPTGRVDRRLVAGALIFGLGWGLVGFCPGPLVAALPVGATPTFVFALAMLAGMAAARSFVAFQPAPVMKPKPR